MKIAKFAAAIMVGGLLSTSVYALGPAANAYGSGYACTNSGGALNMRSNAGQKYKVVAKLSHGTDLVILDSKTASDGMEWYKVRAGKRIGWVRYDYVCGV